MQDVSAEIKPSHNSNDSDEQSLLTPQSTKFDMEYWYDSNQAGNKQQGKSGSRQHSKTQTITD